MKTKKILLIILVVAFIIPLNAEKKLYSGAIILKDYGISLFNLTLKTYENDLDVNATVEFDLFTKVEGDKKFKREKFKLDFTGFFNDKTKKEIHLSTSLMNLSSERYTLASNFSYLCFSFQEENNIKFIQTNGNCGNHIIYGFESIDKLKLPKHGPFWTGSLVNGVPEGLGFLLVPGTTSQPEKFYVQYGNIIDNKFEGDGMYFEDYAVAIGKYTNNDFQGPGRIMYPKNLYLSDEGLVLYYLVTYELGRIVGIATGINKYNGVVKKCDVTNGNWNCKTYIEEYDHDKAVLGNLIKAGTLALVETGLLLELADKVSGPGTSGSNNSKQIVTTPSEICWDKNSINQAKNCGSGLNKLCYEGDIPIYVVKCNNGKNKYFYKTKGGSYSESIPLAADASLPSDYNKMLKVLCGCSK